MAHLKRDLPFDLGLMSNIQIYRGILDKGPASLENRKRSQVQSFGEPSYVTPQGQRHFFDQTDRFGGQRRR